MTHKLNITNGAKNLAASLLIQPDQFNDPSAILRAAHLHAALTKDTPKELDVEYMEKETEFEVSEPQRDLLKESAKKLSPKIPITKHAISLLTALGFE